tara:strand:+ start:1300 stop:1482 length:183 start_codon:yes stop_codon:yes gene_type:complete
MDVFTANNIVKSKLPKGKTTKISQSEIIKTHERHQRKITLKDTKPENIFKDFKKSTKKKK